MIISNIQNILNTFKSTKKGFFCSVPDLKRTILVSKKRTYLAPCNIIRSSKNGNGDRCLKKLSLKKTKEHFFNLMILSKVLD